MATRSGLVRKRGSLPHSGDPMAASHAVHCLSSRGEIAVNPSLAGRMQTVAPFPSATRRRGHFFPDTPARVSSVTAMVDSASWMDTSTTAGALACTACIPAHAPASPPRNADWCPTGRIGGSLRSSTCPVSKRAMPDAQINVRSVAGSSAWGPICPYGEMSTIAACRFSRRSAASLCPATASAAGPPSTTITSASSIAMDPLPWFRYSSNGVAWEAPAAPTAAPASANSRPHTAAANPSPSCATRSPASTDIKVPFKSRSPSRSKRPTAPE